MTKINKYYFTILLGLSVLSCTEKKAFDEKSLPYKQTLRTIVTMFPYSLDWNRADNSIALDNIMDPLVMMDPHNPMTDLKPGLFISWSSSNQFKTWVFQLKKGVLWTDGVELTAKHVKASFERLLTAKTASRFSYRSFVIKNGKAFFEGKLKNFNQVGIKILNPYKIQFELEKPMSIYPKLLVHHSYFPIRDDLVKKYGEKWADPQNIVTLGPFVMRNFENGKFYILERNSKYHGKKTKLKFIYSRLVESARTAIDLFEKHEFDIISGVPVVFHKGLKRKEALNLTHNLALGYLSFNTSLPPMNNKKLRQAISLAIDRKQIANLINKTVTEVYMPKGLMDFKEEASVKLDIRKAKKLLQEAGYNQKKPVPKLTLLLNDYENHKIMCENIQYQLKKNLGIELELRVLEWRAYYQEVNSNPPHISRVGDTPDHIDPDYFLNQLTTSSQENRSKWSNKKYDGLIRLALETKDSKKRRAIYHQAMMILKDEVPVLGIYTGANYDLVDPRVKNYRAPVVFSYRLNQVELK